MTTKGFFSVSYDLSKMVMHSEIAQLKYAVCAYPFCSTYFLVATTAYNGSVEDDAEGSKSTA